MTPSPEDFKIKYETPEDLYFAIEENGMWDFFVYYEPKPEEIADPELRALVKAAIPLVKKLDRIFEGILDRCEPPIEDDEKDDGPAK